jgi:hypothetical protein
MIKLKRLLVEQFALTKKFIGDKNAKLAMIYKLNLRQQQKEAIEKAHEEQHEEALKDPEKEHHHHEGRKGEEQEEEQDENLLTIDESLDHKDTEGEGKQDHKVDEIFLVNQTKT